MTNRQTNPLLTRTLRITAIVLGLALAGCAAHTTAPYDAYQHVLASNDDLADVLTRAGLNETERREVILGLHGNLGADIVQPGHVLTVRRLGTVQEWVEVALDMGADGIVTVEVRDDGAYVGMAPPDLDGREVAVRLALTGDVTSSVANAGLPLTVAAELQEVLDRYAILQGQHVPSAAIDLVYLEPESGGVVDRSPIQFARVDLSGDTYEIIRTNSPERGEFAVYRNEQPILALGLPIEDAPITSTFGGRRHPVYGTARMHSGVDFDAEYGDPVSATGDGQVVSAGWSGGLGNTVRIDHGYGVTTVYAHLSSIDGGIVEGEAISRGDIVGAVGATGLATGTHLHYEVRVDGRATDPLDEATMHAALADASPPSHTRMLLNAFRSMLDDVF
jgi:murein DD-endopeptidase MepM/ murein hydrolase activator NlpD